MPGGAQARHRRIERLHVGEEHGVAAFGEQGGSGKPDALSGAGDEGGCCHGRLLSAARRAESPGF